ncbi:MAG: hypothetical protein ACOH2O_02390 [Pseudomonas sp.]
MGRSVRRMRRLGWGITGLMLLPVLLAMGWKIAQVSEHRAMEATREYLASSLSGLAAQRLANGKVLEPEWRNANPFVLLRWQQDNYGGALLAGAEPKPGYWYWLPARAWIVYRVRFVEGWTTSPGELHAYRLLAGSGATFVLELEAVPVAELSAADWLNR